MYFIKGLILYGLILASYVTCQAKNCFGDNKLSGNVQFIEVKAFNYPVLQGKKGNSFLRIALESDSKQRIVKAIAFELKGRSKENLDALQLFYTGKDSLFQTNKPFGDTRLANKSEVLFEGCQLLRGGINYFWLSMDAAQSCELTAKIELAINYVQVGAKKLEPEEKIREATFRTGVAVRNHWDDNVHTYRIPGLTTTNKGTLLAIYDVRRESSRDLQGHMDIGVSRSVDGGSSWEPMLIAMDMGEWGGLPQKFNGVSDACILVDENSNDIYIAGLWMHGVITSEGKWIEGLSEDSKAWNHQWRNKGSQPGLRVKETSQFLIVKSTDDGKTWGKPVNLTPMCKDPKWWLWAPAPGHGITLNDGTLVFPTQGRDEHGETFSNITYSKDGGKSWKTSELAYDNTTECMAVELSDGGIMLNMRDNRNRQEKGMKNGRAIAVTYDLGETWIEHESSHGALVESVCMASIHRHEFTDKKGQKKSMLLFSNPNSKYKRHKQTIKMSFDDGKTWPGKYWIELDEGMGAGYSCLTSINETTIGILYEGSLAHMVFQMISIEELLNEKK